MVHTSTCLATAYSDFRTHFISPSLSCLFQGVQIDQDSTEKTLRPSASSLTSRKLTSTTAPNPHSGTLSQTMVASSTLIAPTVDMKSSSLLPRKNSNASSSGAHSDGSRSFAQEETSSDSLFSAVPSASHYVIKCNVNPSATSAAPSVTNITPRVKVTVQQPSISTRSSRFDSSTDSISPFSSSSALHLRTPVPTLGTSTTSSAPEYSHSGASSVDDSDDVAPYGQYKTSAHSRQSNPSPELRKNSFDDWIKLEQRYLPRSKSEINTLPTDESHSPHASSQIKPVGNDIAQGNRLDVLQIEFGR